ARAHPKPPELRLPDDAAPVRAAVTLTLVPDSDRVDGEIAIDLDVKRATSVLWLNGTELDVHAARLEAAGATTPADVVPGGDDFIGFSFPAPIAPGRARLVVRYTGKVSPRDDRGVFREVEDGTPYLFSQFENIDARRAFPCFDEPAFKHPWQLTLRVKSSDRAFSNTPVAHEEKGPDGFSTVRFAETKPLPAYLVAFAVGPFDVVDAGRTKSGVPVRVATPKGKAKQAGYAAATTAHIIDLLEDYFGVPYPYPKMDVVPIPRLASFGAMENAGMITIAMQYALGRPEERTAHFERDYVDVMAHELAHQWFGDLVTMRFWDDVWLNEAFATWMGNKTVQRFDPSWRFDVLRARDAEGAMKLDALASARKIRQEIRTKDDIQNAFDGITYEKGATVIGMFEQYLGAEPFRRGIRRYLERHAFGNAAAGEFLHDLGEGAGKDVAAAFSTFLDQPGVPVVTVTPSCARGRAKLAVTQARYLPIGSSAASEAWQIPVCARYGAGKTSGEACGLVGASGGEIDLPGRACPAWVLPNARALGYYHVAYDAKAVDALLGAHAKDLGVAERVSVAEDVAALVAAGKLPAATALARAAELARDPDPQIVHAALDLARAPSVPDATRARYSRYLDKTFGPVAKKLGLRPRPADTPEERLLRPELVVTAAVEGEDAELVAEALRLATKWLDDATAVEPDAVDGVLAAAAAHGDRALFERMRAEAKRTKDDNRRRRIVAALSRFRDPAILRDVFALVLSDDFDPRESEAVFHHTDRFTRDAQLDFLEKHFDAIVARLPTEIAPEIFWTEGAFCDEAQRASAEAFFAPRAAKITGGPRVLAQVMESVRLCIARKKAMEPSVTAFLAKY
ncbi:MAG TPA: M1 family aminopeptidase, partial [Minicystis sp.]|nr:M1 family aminopeptidase [Minicystis sp.]